MNVDLHYMQADAAPKAMPASSQETKAHGAVKPNGCTPQCSEDISRSLALRGNSGDPAAQENGCPGRTPKQGMRTGQPAKLGAACGSQSRPKGNAVDTHVTNGKQQRPMGAQHTRFRPKAAAGDVDKADGRRPHLQSMRKRDSAGRLL